MPTLSSFGPALVGAALVCLTGCGGGVQERKVDPTAARLTSLGQAYGRVVGANKAPRSLADLDKHLKEMGDPAELSQSPRDGKPFVVAWGSRMTDPEPAVLAHEADGVGGRRFVLMTDGAVYELSDADFQKKPKAKTR